MKEKFVTIRMTQELYLLIKKESEKQSRSVSSQIVYCIKNHLGVKND